MDENKDMEEFKVTEVKPEKILQPGEKYNKWVYALLAFFLGAFGLHAFYAGNKKQGIIFVVFFILGFMTTVFYIGIFIIIALRIISAVQMIIALVKPADENGNIS